MGNVSNKDIKAILERNVEEVIDRANLEEKLLSGRKLRIKFGIDPTSPNIHIGRAVVLWKLRALQELGHKVVFIVGDFTGLIGDTSDKDSERPMLSEKQVKVNMKTYFKQVFKILDEKKTETHHNSEWLKKLGFLEICRLADLFGLHEFEARDVISRRLKEGKRVSLREVLYPLMQGYDSAVVKTDVELGGTDQRFNLLAGRVIQQNYGQAAQDILMTSLLWGTDGRKMSSAAGNVINISDKPNDMFGKVMSIHDDLIEKYYKLATNLSENEIIRKTGLGAMDSKKDLAFEITRLYHGAAKASTARKFFEVAFQEKGVPGEVELFKFKLGSSVAKIIIDSKASPSMSRARELVRQKAVELDKKIITDPSFKPDAIGILKIGKKKFIKIAPI